MPTNRPESQPSTGKNDPNQPDDLDFVSSPKPAGSLEHFVALLSAQIFQLQPRPLRANPVSELSILILNEDIAVRDNSAITAMRNLTRTQPESATPRSRAGSFTVSDL